MNSRFTTDELRRAIVALDTIEGHGDRHEWALILRQAHESALSGDRWGNATGNQRISGGLLADRLASLLDEPRDRCEQVAAEVFAPQRHRAIYDALIGYADELTDHPSRRESPPAETHVQRPVVRIVGGREGAA
jgi:hypothetical protein